MISRGRYLRIASASALLTVPIVLASGPASAVPAARAPHWHIVRTFKQRNLSFLDVAALRGGRAWVSGSQGALNSPIFYHWTGAKWIRIPRPGVSGNNVFAGSISASTDSDVWGLLANAAAVDHWNGHFWKRFTFGTQQTGSVGGVAAIRPGLAWVFTHNFTANTDTAWRMAAAVTARPIPGIVDADGLANVAGASSASNIWAWAIDDHVTHKWEALRFNGTKWGVVPIPASLIPNGGGPAQIVVLSAHNVWGTVRTDDTAGRPILLHWNGTSWSRAGGRRPVGTLTGPIAPDGHGGLWLYAVRAKSTFPFTVPFFIHYSHRTWTTYRAPTSPLGPVFIGAIALIPGTTTLWGVGTIQGKSATAGAVVLKFSR